MLMKEIYYGYKKNFYYILIPLILTFFTNAKEVTQQTFKMNFSEVNKNVEYVVSILPSSVSQVRNQLHGFLLILILIAYFVPYRSFSMEGNVMKSILLSPVDNKAILRIKYLAGFILLAFFTLFYGYMADMNSMGILVFLLGGCLFIALGLFFGIYSQNKIINIVSFTLIFFLLIAPRLFQEEYNRLLTLIEKSMSDATLSIITIVVLLIVNVLLEQILEFIWIRKNRRDLI